MDSTDQADTLAYDLLIEALDPNDCTCQQDWLWRSRQRINVERARARQRHG